MFSKTAPTYWTLYCHVGGGTDGADSRLFGLGCRIGPNHVLTAAHVYADADFPVVLLTDGLWKCAVVEEWQTLDIALLRKVQILKRKAEPTEPTRFPSLAHRVPTLGTSLGYIGWLSLERAGGNRSGRTYFGQGHVAFLDTGLRGQTLVAVDGSAVEQGFSGGPVFMSTGELAGVLVEALQYAPKIGESVRQFNALPMVSPVAPIAKELEALLRVV